MMFWPAVFLLCMLIMMLAQFATLYRVLIQSPVAAEEEPNPLYRPMDTVHVRPITREITATPPSSSIHPRRSYYEPNTVMIHYRDPIAKRIRRCKEEDCS